MNISKEELSGLAERVRGLFKPHASKPSLQWKAQFTAPNPTKNDAVMHYALCDLGVFEIYEGETGSDFLLLYPKSIRKPADLFHSLSDAKAEAIALLLSLQSQEPL